MKIWQWGLIVIAVLVLILVSFLFYMGVFSTPKTYEAVMGPYTIAYESYVGPYSQTGPVFNKVYEAVKAAGIETTRGLGIYYDNPARVAADKLRSDCGVIIEDVDLPKFNMIKKQFKVKVVPKKMCIVAEFPIRNVLSYMIGPMKGYPALMKHADEKGYQYGLPYELYDETQKKVFFVMELVR